MGGGRDERGAWPSFKKGVFSVVQLPHPWKTHTTISPGPLNIFRLQGTAMHILQNCNSLFCPVLQAWFMFPAIWHFLSHSTLKISLNLTHLVSTCWPNRKHKQLLHMVDNVARRVNLRFFQSEFQIFFFFKIRGVFVSQSWNKMCN